MNIEEKEHKRENRVRMGTEMWESGESKDVGRKVFAIRKSQPEERVTFKIIFGFHEGRIYLGCWVHCVRGLK